MTAWIEEPDWSDPVGRRLRRLLEETVWKRAELQDLWRSANLPMGVIPWEQEAVLVWAAMLKSASPEKLRVILELVGERSPAVQEDLEQILATQVAGPWYQAPDAFRARLLGPGQRSALIDRDALRECLQQVEADDYAVFAISGDSGTGKSHSRHLIKHVAALAKQAPEVLIVSIKDEWPEGDGVTELHAPEFARVLALKVGVDPSFVATIDMNTEATRIAKDLAIALAERYRRIGPPPRWLFLDGLDRPGVLSDVHAFVAHLSLAAAERELGPTRLIITGYSGAFSDSVEDALVTEQIEAITKHHVQGYFEEIGRHFDAQLTESEAESMATDALAQAGTDNLRKLERVVVQMAKTKFGGS